MVKFLTMSAVPCANHNHVQATFTGVAAKFSCERTERGKILR
jgi:hypothetical protein